MQKALVAGGEDKLPPEDQRVVIGDAVFLQRPEVAGDALPGRLDGAGAGDGGDTAVSAADQVAWQEASVLSVSTASAQTPGMARSTWTTGTLRLAMISENSSAVRFSGR